MAVQQQGNGNGQQQQQEGNRFAQQIAELEARLKATEAERDTARANAAGQGKITLKVSKRGLVSVYGLGRMPTSLYPSQWARLLAFVSAPADNAIAAFVGGKPVAMFDPDSDFRQGADPAFLAEIKAGKHKHATVREDGMVRCSLSMGRE